MIEISKNSRRAAEIGGAIFIKDAVDYDIYTRGIMEPHSPCVAVENVSSADLKVGLVMATTYGDWEYAVTTLEPGAYKPYQSMLELKLTDVAGTYATTDDVSTLSFTAVDGRYYLIACNVLDAPADNTILEIDPDELILASSGKDLATNVIKHTFTRKGLTYIMVKGTASGTATITAGEGMSAASEATKPTFKIYGITAWNLQELNVIF